MKGLLKKGFFLALGFWALPAGAEEVEWFSLPAKQADAGAAATAAHSAPVSLSRPIPLKKFQESTLEIQDAQLRPVAIPMTGVRTQTPQPLPSGPAVAHPTFAPPSLSRPIPTHRQDPIITEVIETQPPMDGKAQVPNPQTAPPMTNPPAAGGTVPGPMNLHSPRIMAQPVPGSGVPYLVPHEGMVVDADPGVPGSAKVFTSPGMPMPQGGCGCSTTGMPLPYSSRILGAECDCCEPMMDCCECPTMCCFPRSRYWVNAEYLMLRFKNMNLPPLVTTGPAADGFAIAGSLDRAGTQVLYGGQSTASDYISGMRIGGGFWFARNDAWGLDASGFFTGWRSQTFNAKSAANGSPVISRPLVFADGQTILGEGVEVVSFPGRVAGSIAVTTKSQIWGFDVNARRKLWCGPQFYFDGLIGYRYFQLRENLTINENLVTLPSTVPGAQPAGLVNLIEDNFSTRNTFNGVQLGFETEFRFWRRWSLQGQFKIALGNVHQQLNISGSTTFINNTGAAVNNLPAGGVQRLGTGILANATNIGSWSQDNFAVMPEVGIKLGYNITERLRLFVGYDFMYLSNVIRPGDSVDRTVDITLIPEAGQPGPVADAGQTRPAVIFKNTDFWAQGFRAGLEYQW